MTRRRAERALLLALAAYAIGRRYRDAVAAAYARGLTAGRDASMDAGFARGYYVMSQEELGFLDEDRQHVADVPALVTALRVVRTPDAS